MKRVIATLMLLALCCGCAGQGEPVSSAPDVSRQPVATPEPTEKPEPTAGGFAVKTDFSQYTPYEKEEGIFTRLSEGPLTELIPSDDYGMLYPFVGSMLYSKSYGYYGGSLYGLFDESGRIVVDPVYTEVEYINYSEGFTWNTVNIPMLQLGKTEGDWQVFTIATPDGSFVSEESYGYVRGSAFGVMCADSYDSEEFVFYDLHGNVLLTQDDMKLNGLKLRYGLNSIGMSDSGVFVLTTGEPDSMQDACYLMNLQGELIAGPYSGLFDFKDGRCVFQQEGGSGVIDSRGNVIIPAEYMDIGMSDDGKLIARKYTGGGAVFDRNGQLIFETEYNYPEPVYGGYRDYTADIYYDEQGNVTELSGQGWTQMHRSMPIVYRQSDEKLELMNTETGKTRTLEGLYDVMPLYSDYMAGVSSSIEAVCLIGHDEDYMNYSYQLLGWDMEFKLEDEIGDSYPVTVGDHVNGKEYLYVAGDLYPSDFRLQMEGLEGIPQIWNGRIIANDELYCNVYDLPGELLLRYPMMFSDGD